MMSFIKKITLVLFLVIGVVFVFQNLEELSKTMQLVIDLGMIKEGLIFKSPPFPVVLLFVAFFILGMLTAGVHSIYERFARKAGIRMREKRIGELEAELEGVKKKLYEAEAAARPPAPSSGTVAAPTSAGSVAAEAGAGYFDGAPPKLPADANPAEPAAKPAVKPQPMEEEPTL